MKSLIRPLKPWVIPAHAWKASGLTLEQIAQETRSAVVVAKPSENLYLGKSVGSLDPVSAGIANIASHGEMAVGSIISADPLTPTAFRLVNVLPSKVAFEKAKIGEKRGRLLNHFGYRKIVMNLVPESLSDHAWIANALSYSTKSEQTFFDPQGGGLAGGIAAELSDGSIFRGSAIGDDQDVLVSAWDSLLASLAANGRSESEIIKTSQCALYEEFTNHRLYRKLAP